MNTYPAVLWPPHKTDLMLDIDGAVWIVQRMVGTLPDEEYEADPEPTQDQIDEWMMAGSDDGEVSE